MYHKTLLVVQWKRFLCPLSSQWLSDDMGVPDMLLPKYFCLMRQKDRFPLFQTHCEPPSSLVVCLRLLGKHCAFCLLRWQQQFPGVRLEEVQNSLSCPTML